MSLHGVRVLLVEDETHVASLLEMMLEDLGCVLAGSAWRLPQAIELAHKVEADVAILDVNLAGERVFPAAEVLRSRGIPFLFSTGYGSVGLLDGFDTAPALTKPFRLEDLGAALTALMDGRAE